jgi:hypothetical protein
MWSAEAGSFSFILGEIHFAVLRPAGYLPRRMTGANAGRKAVASRPHSKKVVPFWPLNLIMG